MFFLSAIFVVATTEATPGAGLDRFDWVAPQSCPQREAVTDNIDALLGEARALEQQRSVQAQGTIVAAQDGQWVLVLTTSTASGSEQRRLKAANCDALGEAAAVMVATAIDPLAGPVIEDAQDDSSTSATATPPERPPIAARTDDDSAPSPVARTQEPPKRWGGFVGLATGLSEGALPSWAWALQAAIDMRRAWLRLALTGTYVAPRTTAPLADGSGAGRIQLWSVGSEACAVPRLGQFEFPVCLGLEVGGMRGRGAAIEGPARATALWAAVEAGPRMLYWASPRFGFGAQADLQITVSRPGFAIDGAGVVHRAAPVSALALATAEVRFH